MRVHVFSCCTEYYTEVWVSPLWLTTLDNVFQEQKKETKNSITIH